MRFIILTISLAFYCGLTWALDNVATHLVITKPTILRSASFFSSDTFAIGSLKKGDTCQILNVDTNKSSGVGLYVKVLEGSESGRLGWIYLHNLEDSRTLELHDSNGKPVIPSKNSVNSEAVKIKEYLEKNVDRFVDATTVLPESYKIVETNDEVWNKIYDGTYTIVQKDPVLGTITISHPVMSNGESKSVMVNIPYDFGKVLRIPKEIAAHATKPSQASCTACAAPVIPEFKDYKWQPGCEALAHTDLTSDFDSLTKCLTSIKKIITKSGVKNSSVKKHLYDLNPAEQEFAAMTISSFGEAGILAPPLEEMVAIMKVLDNRVSYAKENGFAKANALDAAIQGSQFSMWNNGFKNKKTKKFQYEQWYYAVKAAEHHPTVINSIKSFILFKKSKFTPKDTADAVYHYHTDYVKPDWRSSKKIVKLKINDNSLKSKGTRHIFYRNIPWNFEYTSYKPKGQR